VDTTSFDPARIRANAQRFDLAIFRASLAALLNRYGVDARLVDQVWAGR
jgi:hypothetical protein